jgi:zinc-ribbon domain
MECIQSLTTLGTNNPNTKVLIGAITDGNSNPKLIPELSNVFDFYMNAEMVGIGKPHKRIYVQAAKDVFQKYPMAFDDLIAQATMENDEISDEQIEELLGPWWIYIGDDFIKDIVASNSLKMRNIWTRELCSTKKVEAPQIGQQDKPVQRTVNELMQVVNERKVVEMSIGADTYLADTVSNEFATAVVDELRDVVSILQKWQNDALVSSPALRQNIDNNIETSTLKDETMSIAPSPTNASPGRSIVNSDTKFCIECGTKLPLVAKFCSACGAAQ